MKITVNDIARVAKVSQTTVSRVLNNYPQIKESTRKRVLDAIDELKFTPDSVARSMVTNKTNTLGLIVGDISNPFFAESAKIIIGKAQKLNYDVIVSNTNHEDGNLDHSIRTLMSKRVDGILISSVNRTSTIIKDLYGLNFPIVLFNSRVEDESSNYIVLDNKKGAMLAVDHLVDLGHKKIAFINGLPKYLTLFDRYVGYKAALKKRGIDYRQDYVYDGAFSYDKVYEFVIELLSRDDRPTSFFATSDQMALAVMDGAASKNIRIPEELSIVGFDNMSISSNRYIGLTTISQQKEEMSLTALEKLLLLINKRESVTLPIQITLEPELIVRNTTGLVPKG
ncbi:LacI family DNA-binding transcriptional regulator [Pseudalkalibacillus sp. A8]|uniref:LacI family DNA-binding transcriptional regulator n=1 Tax=Pseudalkalibacillus sp. A8 TaxID=3382641 RepID=UPI0038B5C986